MSSPVTTPPDAVPPIPAQATTVVVPPVAYPVAPRAPKSPGLALVLSLFPGLGQLYNGQVAKAFVFFSAFVTSIYLAAEVDGMPFGFFIPFVLFYGLIDAWKSASLINARAAGRPEIVEEVEDDTQSPAWGVALVGIGLVLLMANFGWLQLIALRRWWPVIFIVIGLVFLRRAFGRRDEAATATTTTTTTESRHETTV
ncbi:MAG TPA: DUF5668 domain-containing protein [Vicinamibacteria bacterium]|nr:DUF5668 domain-containing protein [Vicinamibacteria bacterium]